MNKQRRVVITTTYNEMGIIIDTKAEEVAQPNLQPICNQLATDCISRQAAIDAANSRKTAEQCEAGKTRNWTIDICVDMIKQLPSAQPEQQWIPWDSGKFPEESGTYTVTAYDGAIKRVTYAKYQKRLKRWKLTGARAYWRVLAWMPLPEPYKERMGE